MEYRVDRVECECMMRCGWAVLRWLVEAELGDEEALVMASLSRRC